MTLYSVERNSQLRVDQAFETRLDSSIMWSELDLARSIAGVINESAGDELVDTPATLGDADWVESEEEPTSINLRNFATAYTRAKAQGYLDNVPANCEEVVTRFCAESLVTSAMLGWKMGQRRVRRFDPAVYFSPGEVAGIMLEYPEIPPHRFRGALSLERCHKARLPYVLDLLRHHDMSPEAAVIGAKKAERAAAVQAARGQV